MPRSYDNIAEIGSMRLHRSMPRVGAVDSGDLALGLLDTSLIRHRARPLVRVVSFVQDRVGASADIVREANAVVNDRAGWSMPMRQIALAIGSLESGFGVSGSWLMANGTPSYNWGALTGSGTAGSITHADNKPDGTPTTYDFAAFHNLAEAFDAFRRTWTRGDVAGDKTFPHEATVDAAASRGDAYNVARTMYAHRYYGGTPAGSGAWHPSQGSDDERRIQTYAQAIVGAAKSIASTLGEPLQVYFEVSTPAAPPSIASPLGIGVVLGGVGYALGAGPIGAAALGVAPVAIWYAARKAAA